MEANNLYIFYQSAATNDRVPERVLDEVRKAGTMRRIMPNVWRVQSDQSGLCTFERVAAIIDQRDQLLVVDATNDTMMCWPEQDVSAPEMMS